MASPPTGTGLRTGPAPCSTSSRTPKSSRLHDRSRPWSVDDTQRTGRVAVLVERGEAGRLVEDVEVARQPTGLVFHRGPVASFDAMEPPTVHVTDDERIEADEDDGVEICQGLAGRAAAGSVGRSRRDSPRSRAVTTSSRTGFGNLGDVVDGMVPRFATGVEPGSESSKRCSIRAPGRPDRHPNRRAPELSAQVPSMVGSGVPERDAG